MVWTTNKATMGISFLLLFACFIGGAEQVYARGNGIQAGPGRLHPSIDLSLVFDTNPSYSSNNAFSDLILQMRPGLTLEFPSDTVSFELNSKVGYDYYFGVENSNSTNLSTIAGEADLKLGFNPNGQFSFFIEDVFSRSGDPRYSAVSGRFDRTNNEAKAHFQFKPGGGALMFDLAYGFFIDWFDDSGVNAQALSSYGHRIYFSGKWKFLPKTAVTIDFDSDIRRYPNGYDNGTKNIDINAIRATAGMIGQISPSLSLVIKAGYGDTLLDAPTGYTGSDFRSAIGQAEVNFQVGTMLLQGGYLRNFQPAPLYAYFGQDRFYLRYRQLLAGRFTLSAHVGFDLLDYGTGVQADAGERFDFLLTGGASFEYHILDWLALGLDYRLQALFSDYAQPLAGAGGVEYSKHAFGFRVSLDY